jgi:hypothetical protein
VRVRVRVIMRVHEGEGELVLICIPHPFVCLQVGVCYLSRAFSGVVGLASVWLSDACNNLLLLLL